MNQDWNKVWGDLLQRLVHATVEFDFVVERSKDSRYLSLICNRW